MMLGSVLATVLVFGPGGFSVAADEPLQAPGTQLVIGKKKPARFNHATHLKLGIDCGTCHHTQDHNPLTVKDIASMTDASKLRCVSCHNGNHPNTKLRKAKGTFHACCINCHKSGYKGKQGPTKCSGCHLKKKRRVLEGC